MQNHLKIVHQKNDSGSSYKSVVSNISSPSRSVKSQDSNPEYVEVAAEVIEDKGSAMAARESEFTHVSVDESAKYIQTVPINSYTSSDEDEVDEFFDANDEFGEITIDEIESSLKLEEGFENTEASPSSEQIIDLNKIILNESADQNDR